MMLSDSCNMTAINYAVLSINAEAKNLGIIPRITIELNVSVSRIGFRECSIVRFRSK